MVGLGISALIQATISVFCSIFTVMQSILQIISSDPVFCDSFLVTLFN
jgi:hypothetical protein